MEEAYLGSLEGVLTPRSKNEQQKVIEYVNLITIHYVHVWKYLSETRYYICTYVQDTLKHKKISIYKLKKVC